MRITGTKKIIVEDFPTDYREVVQKLSQIVNPHLEQVTQAANGNMTLADNLKSKVYRQQLADGVSTISLRWDINERPTDVHIGQLTRADGAIPGVHSLHWLYADGQIACTFTGLTAGIHNVTIIAQV